MMTPVVVHLSQKLDHLFENNLKPLAGKNKAKTVDEEVSNHFCHTNPEVCVNFDLYLAGQILWMLLGLFGCLFGNV